MLTFTSTSTKEVQDQILSFISAGAQTADGLRRRTWDRLHQVVKNHFDNTTNQHSFERIDWRIIQGFFSHLFAHGPAWARIAEELYPAMEYIDEPLPISPK